MLGGWYFNGNKIATPACDSNGPPVQSRGASISSYVGVIDLYECGTFSIAGEGVYTCIIMNSSMINESMRLGVYYNGRSKYT